jgi:hypothetical protein
VSVVAVVLVLQLGGVAFPLPIMALVPVRQYLLPRVFKPGHLTHLDAAEYEQAPPLAEQGTQNVGWEVLWLGAAISVV